MTTVVIMQPNYLPWLGFFELMWRADVFVVYDTVQFDSGGWRNRTRVKTAGGPCWLTVPVTLPRGVKTTIDEVRIAADPRWPRKHLATLRQAYSRAPFFADHFPGLAEIVATPKPRLADLLVELIDYLNAAMGLSRTVLRASAMKVTEEDRILRLIRLVQAAGGDHFYEPAGGKRYLGPAEIDTFRRHGIGFEFQDFHHPVYPQQHGPFVPAMSAVDLLFNAGPECLGILTGGAD